MKAPDDLLYEYAVIRFVPRVDREEFINIGLLMLNKRNKWLKSAININESRIRALYPDADIECLKKQSSLYEKTGIPGPDLPVEEQYRWLSAVKSACIQVSPSHPGLLTPSDSSRDEKGDKEEGDYFKGEETVERMEKEFTRLFDMLVM